MSDSMEGINREFEREKTNQDSEMKGANSLSEADCEEKQRERVIETLLEDTQTLCTRLLQLSSSNVELKEKRYACLSPKELSVN